MSNKKSHKSGCLSILGVLFVIGLISNLFNHSEGTDTELQNSAVEQTASTNSVKSIPSSASSTDDNKAEEVDKLWKEIGLDKEKYKEVTGETSRIDWQFEANSLTGNYQNLTVDRVTSIFSDLNIDVKTIFENLGNPDVVWIDYSSVYNNYIVEAWWNETNDTSTEASRYMKLEWPIDGKGDGKSFFGIPSDLPNVTSSQSIVEFGEFKGVKLE